MKQFILIILILWSANSLACGSVSRNMMGYWSLETIESKENFLLEQNCYQAMNYSPLRADPIIAKVFKNAAGAGVSKSVLRKLIESFNCVYGAYYSKNMKLFPASLRKMICNRYALTQDWIHPL